MGGKEKNVFISHYSKDDEHIGKLKVLLGNRGYTIKNSSIDSTKPNQANNPEYVKSILRSRIQWAGTTIVLIGPNTHKRDWVNWEIEQSNKAGNRIVGTYIHGETDSIVPESFEKYGDALVGWDSGHVIDAIEGLCNNFENPDGSERPGKWQISKGIC